MKLIEDIKEVMKDRKVSDVIKDRMKSFSKKRDEDELFIELSFCIMTANFSAKRGWYIQKEIGEGFIRLSEKNLEKRLRDLGYRFPATRANYIVTSRKRKRELAEMIKRTNDGEIRDHELREWLVKNIKGFGWKEASHFLRNIGFKNFAIIDSHILNILEDNRIITRPKTLSKKNYLEIEKKIGNICKRLSLTQAELDLYLWYMETGTVMK